jgi:hypothetical protein
LLWYGSVKAHVLIITAGVWSRGAYWGKIHPRGKFFLHAFSTDMPHAIILQSLQLNIRAAIAHSV